MFSKAKLLRLAATVVPMVCAAGFAQAQKAGTYNGQSADGNFMSMTVTESGGVFTITNTSVDFVATCRHPPGTASEGWGFYLGIPVSAGTANFHSGDDYYDITGVANFPNNRTIRGTVTSLTAVFVPGTTPPNQAYFCASPNQAFTLTYQTPATAPSYAPGIAVALKPHGTKQ